MSDTPIYDRLVNRPRFRIFWAPAEDHFVNPAAPTMAEINSMTEMKFGGPISFYYEET